MRLSCTRSARHERVEMALLLEECEIAAQQGQSERSFCQQAGIARSTLRDAAERELFVDAPEAVVSFFTSSEGELFLRRLVVAAHVALTLLGSCGVPLVMTFLRLAGLSPFVACSYSAQRRLHLALHQHVIAFAEAERQRLGAAMPSKKVWLCEDETFFPRMVLVAIDALSGFVLVERFADRRDAPTWNQAVAEGLSGLRIEVAGVTSDQAKGLVCHVETGLRLSHTPDLFHVQHDLCKSCSGPLSAQVRALEKTAEQDPTPDAIAALEQAKKRQERMGELVRAISAAEHPYSLESGEVRRGSDVEALLAKAMAEALTLLDEAGLSAAAWAGFDKALRAAEALADAVERFHGQTETALAQLRLPRDIEESLRTRVLPALYLEHVADRAPTAAEREARHGRAKAWLLPLQDEEASPMMQLSEAAVASLLEQGRQWVALFVRASSCVEGRNGQLSLRHHGLRSLSESKLAALTAVHNFWLEREDGTTAAERLFGQKPRDLFEHLLDIMPELPRPAQRRPRVAPSALLN